MVALTQEATSLVDTLAAQDDPPAPKRLPSSHKAYQASQAGTWTYPKMRQLAESKSNPKPESIGEWLRDQARLALERRPMMRRLGKP